MIHGGDPQWLASRLHSPGWQRHAREAMIETQGALTSVNMLRALSPSSACSDSLDRIYYQLEHLEGTWLKANHEKP